MKNIKTLALSAATKLALSTARREVNSTCIMAAYQPLIPQCANKLKKG